MSKLLWTLSIITLPLLMVKYYRFEDIPATHLFLIAGGALNMATLIRLKTGKIEKVIYLVFSTFILIAFLDLLRSEFLFDNFFFEFKLILLLITLRLYSFFLCRYGMDYFIQYLALSSVIVLSILMYRSLFVLKAPFFVVDVEQITESGKNQLAFYLALIIPMVIWYSRKQNLELFWKLVMYSTLLIFLLAAFYVQSKGLILSVLLSFFVTIVFYSRLKLKIVDFIKSALILSIPVYFILSQDYVDMDSFGGEIKSLLSQDINNSNSAEERVDLISKSFYHFSNNPLVGIGTNNFASIEERATHNNYLQVLAENGLIGFLIFIGLFLFIHFSLSNMKMNNSYYQIVVNSLWSLTIYLLVINGFFNAITVIVLAVIIYYEKYYLMSLRSLSHEG